MKLGVTADLHGNLKKARKAASFFKKSDVDAVVLAGDVPSDSKQEKYFTRVLQIFSKINKKILITPGSHEHYKEYYSTLKKFRKNKNIIDCTKKPLVKLNEQKLIFVVGADTSGPGAGFRLLRDRKQLRHFKTYIKNRKDHFWGKVTPIFLSDLTKFIDKNAILISHSPAKFNTPHSTDFAKFGEPKKSFILLKRHKKLSKTTGGIIMVKGVTIFGLDEAKHLLKKGYPVKLRTKNVGNPWLKALVRKKKITKFICGHIHESGGRATDLKGKPVKPNKWSKELFYNCSGRAGIVEFLNNQAKYKEVRL
jgi:DNA repair exonuclease SbcCD nuclease subunit